MLNTTPASAYDSADRLLSFQRGLLAGGGGSVSQHLSLPGVDYQRSYNLDGLGNWVDDGWSGTAPAVSFSHDCAPDSQSRTTNELNQIASVDEAGLDYDDKGNLLSYGGLSFTYDAFNRLIGVSGTGPDGSSVDQLIVYDARNRRVYKGTTDFSDYSEFYFDGPQVIGETGPAGLKREYVWGQYVDELVQQREYENPPSGGEYEDLYPLSDLLYRTVALARQNPCGSGSGGPAIPFAEVYDTDVYGRTRAYNSPGPDGRWFSDDDVRTFDPICRYLFTGREYDSDTGLYYYRSRYYHPDLGRFLTRDSIGYQGGMNLYGYCRGSPLVHIDPSGRAMVPSYGRKGNAALGQAVIRFFDSDKPRRFATGVAQGALIAAAFVGVAFLLPELALAMAALGVVTAAVALSELIAGNDFSGTPVDRWNMSGQLVGGLIGGSVTARGITSFSAGRLAGNIVAASRGEALGFGDRYLGRISGRWLSRAGLEVIFRGQNSPLPPGQDFLSPIARGTAKLSSGETGFAASLKMEAMLRQAGLDDAMIAKMVARWNDTSLPAMFGSLAGEPGGGVGIPFTRIPGIAAGPDFGGSGPEGIVYSVLVRGGAYLRPPNWRLSDEEELIVLHYLSRSRIISSYPGQSIPPIVGGQ